MHLHKYLHFFNILFILIIFLFLNIQLKSYLSILGLDFITQFINCIL